LRTGAGDPLVNHPLKKGLDFEELSRKTAQAWSKILSECLDFRDPSSVEEFWRRLAKNVAISRSTGGKQEK
jgi:hypothetical protein